MINQRIGMLPGSLIPKCRCAGRAAKVPVEKKLRKVSNERHRYPGVRKMQAQELYDNEKQEKAPGQDCAKKILPFLQLPYGA